MREFLSRIGIPQYTVSLVGIGDGSVILVFQVPKIWRVSATESIDVKHQLQRLLLDNCGWLFQHNVIGFHISGYEYCHLSKSPDGIPTDIAESDPEFTNRLPGVSVSMPSIPSTLSDSPSTSQPLDVSVNASTTPSKTATSQASSAVTCQPATGLQHDSIGAPNMTSDASTTTPSKSDGEPDKAVVMIAGPSTMSSGPATAECRDATTSSVPGMYVIDPL